MGRRWKARVPIEHPGAALTAEEGGSSVVEVLAATLCFSLLMGISYSLVRSGFSSLFIQENRSEAQEVTLMAVDLWTREMRMAGFSASGAPLLGVRAASRERVEVAADFDGDGNSEDANELIAYSYNQSKNELVRATGGGSPQPLVRNVLPGGLEFRFFDAEGTEISAAGEQMSAADRGRVHRVDMRLSVTLAADPASGVPVVSTVTGSACLRNQ